MWWRPLVVLTLVLAAGCATSDDGSDRSNTDDTAAAPGAAATPAATSAPTATVAAAEPTPTEFGPRLVEPGDVVVMAIEPVGAVDQLVLLDETGGRLAELAPDGTIWPPGLQEVAYPERVLAVVEHANGRFERLVINMATGATASLGTIESMAGIAFVGQPRAGSRWYRFSSLMIDGSPEVLDLETMQVRTLAGIPGLNTVEVSRTDEFVAARPELGTIVVFDAQTLEPVWEITDPETRPQLGPFDPSGERLLITEDLRTATDLPAGTSAETGVSIANVRSGVVTEIALDIAGFGWLSDDEILALDVVSGDMVVVDLATGDFTSSFPRTSAPGLGAFTAPWEISELDERVVVTNRRTGEVRTFTPARPLWALSGIGRIPDQRYVWASGGDFGDQVDEVAMVVVDTETGDIHEFNAPNPGGYVGAATITLSDDATRALVVSQTSTFLLQADGSITELPAASSASFCDDERFVLTEVRVDGSREVVLYADGAGVSIGSYPRAFCSSR